MTENTVIVKTLDGRNHEFFVPDNITVIDFKGKIQEKMDIAVDRQRLLFQGRVLQDENLLSSYNVAGNVMHLVTRPPPSQNRPQTEATNDREENSDINRDQIRNIITDVIGTLGDFNNPLGVSVNNEGNRVDITVNMPGTNRLSLARLRQNYVHRLMSQARELLEHIRDSSRPAPRPDRERLYQANAYDLGQNEERITEVTAQPLPIHNLADMVHSIRELWREADPQLEVWENVLRRENLPESISGSDQEMQRMHDSASRYIHLFSHMLHIMSDYLVEFHQSSGTRVHVHRAASEIVTPTNEAATSTSIDENIAPLTGGFGESGLLHSSSGSDSNSSTATVTGAANPLAQSAVTNGVENNNDRSRYLYVFSEMPAQLLQVRLDVDSSIPMNDLLSAPSTNQPRPMATRSNETRNVPAPTEQTNTIPTVGATSSNQTSTTSESTPRNRRRDFNPVAVENIIRNTFQEPFTSSSSSRIVNGSSGRPIRNGSQLIDNVDPYVRCQSRHFQSPSSLRTGAVISTFGGIRFRESSRTRPRPTESTTPAAATATAPPFTTANNASAPPNANTNPFRPNNVNAPENRDVDPFRYLLGGLFNSFFSSSGDNTTTTAATNPSAGAPPRQSVGMVPNVAPFPPLNLPNIDHLQSMNPIQAFTVDTPLGEMFPELFNHENDTENNITNQIIRLVVNRLTMIDFTQIIHGIYHPLNSLRLPLQELLQRHQQQCDGSRDRMLEHVVMDLEFFNRVYITIFDRLRGPESVDGLSEDARNNFNRTIDIPRTINNLNRHHARMVVDMILRSPTDIGFGQLLMNGMLSHHNESLALLDIICNNNDELRQYMVRSFIESLMASMDESSDSISQLINHNRSRYGMDLIFGNIHSRLFRRPDHVSQLRDNVMASYVVLLDINTIDCNSTENEISRKPVDIDDQIMTNIDSLEDMVNSLSGNIINTRAIPTEIPRPIELMDVCSYQQEGSLSSNNHTVGQPNGGVPWQTVLPTEWLDIVSRDSNTPVEQHTIGIPYSDAYVSGMPPKRRKIILNQRSRLIQRAPEMMHDCIDQAIQAAGLADTATAASAQSNRLHQSYEPNLTSSFQELVSDHVRNRLVEESFNFPNDRFSSTEQSFNRKKRAEEDKKSNN